jgi:tetratricopeptide (TPR) repeat protein
LVKNDLGRAAEQYEKGRRLAPGDSRFLFATALVEQGLGRWEASLEDLRQAERLNPLSVPNKRVLGFTLLRMRRYSEAREALDRALAVAPTNRDVIEYKAMTYLAQGDLPGARSVLKAAPKEVDQTGLVADFANYYGLGWVLDDEQRDLLLRLTPSAFDDDKGHWAACLADAYALRGDAANMRRYIEEAAKAFEEQLVSAPEDSGRHMDLGLALALLGRKVDAIREGERAVALDPVAKDQLYGAYIQHQLACIYIRVGEPEKALDQLEPLLKMPYYLSPNWLAIDPNFDPLRGNPRFQKLVAGAK